MDSDVSLARLQQRWEQLLDRASDEESGTKRLAKGREKGAKKYGAGWGGKRTKIKRTKKTSKSVTEVKGSPNTKAGKLGRDNTSRAAAGRLKGGNLDSGGNSKELADGRRIKPAVELKWPADRCDAGTDGSGHFMIKLRDVDNGSIWMCKNCGMAKWLPSTSTECLELGVDMKKVGLDAAYRSWLSSRPEASNILAKIESLKLARSSLTDAQWISMVSQIVMEG